MDFRFALLTVGGLGHMRPVSGTWGSMPPVILAGVMMAAGLGPIAHPAVYHAVIAAVLVVFSLACVMYGDRAEARYGRKDPSQVVADETAGQSFSVMLLPAAALATPARGFLTLLLCFLLFRVMDIVKPYPAHRLQNLPGGWGILVDDLLAGIYAMLLVQLATRLLF